MLFEEMLQEEREAGRAEGLEAGRREGEEAALQKMNRLVQILSEQSRLADIVKASTDEAYQKKLFEEFNL